MRINQIATPKIGSPIAAHWDIPSQSLYFVNFVSSSEPVIYRYSYKENRFYSAYLNGVNALSFIVPIESSRGDLFAVGSDNNVLKIRWDGCSNQAQFIQTLFVLDANNPVATTGYARASPGNRFFGGTLAASYCSNVTDFSPYSFYRYDRQRGLVNLFSGAFTAGVAFNVKTRKMYHLAPCQLLITEFDWDPQTGDICKRESHAFNLL